MFEIIFLQNLWLIVKIFQNTDIHLLGTYDTMQIIVDTATVLVKEYSNYKRERTTARICRFS